MNELIKIKVNKNKEGVVSGRELHNALGVKTQYSIWFNNLLKYGFEENVDYVILIESEINTKKIIKLNKRGRKQINHAITLDMAKEVSMTINNEIGSKIRKYFIECEKLLREGKQPVRSFTDILIGKKPTKNHLKNQKRWKLEGRTEKQIKRRNHSVFLNISRNEYLLELEIASPNLCSKISDIFNVAITGQTAKELYKNRNIPQWKLVRDYFNEVELIAIVEAENLLGLYLENEHGLNGKPSFKKIIELANESANLAHKKAIQVSKTMNVPYHDYEVQKELSV
jgi:phage anti-repressor protein